MAFALNEFHSFHERTAFSIKGCSAGWGPALQVNNNNGGVRPEIFHQTPARTKAKVSVSTVTIQGSVSHLPTFL